VKEKGSLEERIAEWRNYVLRRQALDIVDVEELEDHLRTQVEALGDAGLCEGEAFLVAVERLGDLDALSREFAREYSERLWKQLVIPSGGSGSSRVDTRNALVAIGCAIAAGISIKLPELFGLAIASDTANSFYLRNFSLFVLPFLAGYFAWKRALRPTGWCWSAVSFVAAGLIVNLLPLVPNSHTELLTAIHIPIALWLAVGYAYAGGGWRSHGQRMNYVRFTGEWFIYYTLIALGGGVLIGFALFVFEAIDLNAEPLISEWILPCGIMGAVLISAWLVESKQSVIENMAPVLTRLFTPLFAGLLLVFVTTMIWTGNAIDIERGVLIGFDLLLAIVLGLLLYSISARDHQVPPGPFDWVQLVLVLCALLVDALALWAIAARISEFGFSPNKTAALGENLILLVNLGWSAVLYARFLAKRAPFARLERWQTAYIPVYAVWAWIVAALFPIIFDYR